MRPKCHHPSTLSTATTAVHQHSMWSAFRNTPVNMPDPIRTLSGSAGKHWPEVGWMILAHWLASGPDPFGQNLTQSARPKLDPGWFCTILSGTSVEERNWVWNSETGSRLVVSCQKPGQMIPTHQLASRPDASGETLTRPSRSDPVGFAHDPCLLWKNGAEMNAGSWILHILSNPILTAHWP